eukprot:scpid100135/ scgid15888/ 
MSCISLLRVSDYARVYCNVWYSTSMDIKRVVILQLEILQNGDNPYYFIRHRVGLKVLICSWPVPKQPLYNDDTGSRVLQPCHFPAKCSPVEALHGNPILGSMLPKILNVMYMCTCMGSENSPVPASSVTVF